MTARRIVVTGSVAYDYLMTFPGKFLDVWCPDRMDRLSVSFLVDSMRKVRGGVAPNIAYTLALLGLSPSSWRRPASTRSITAAGCRRQGVDTSALHICDDLFTASFFVSTDQATEPDRHVLRRGHGARLDAVVPGAFPSSVSLAIIAPNAPEAMAKYATECRELHIAFVYDPSQQVARLSGEELLGGLQGAAMLIANEYEFGVIEMKTGLSEAEVLSHVPVLVVTRGAEGSTIALRGGQPEAPAGVTTFHIPPARLRGDGSRPDGRRRRVSRRASRGTPPRAAVGGRGPRGKRGGGLRARSPRPAAAPVFDPRVHRPLRRELRLRRTSRARQRPRATLRLIHSLVR